MWKPPSWALFLGVVGSLTPVAASELSFERRVEARRAVARLYHEYQVGSSRPFEKALPDEMLRLQVSTYLKQSAALERFWGRRVTARDLQAELERMARSTRYPVRLRSLYAALGNDPLLVQETLVRPVLVDRLARRLFRRDPRIHEAARAEAEGLRKALLEARGHHADIAADRRMVLELVRGMSRGTGEEVRPFVAGARLVELAPEEFDRWRARLPAKVRQIGPVVARPDAFVVEVLLHEERDRLRLATYSVPKTTWEAWWKDVAPTLESGVAMAPQPAYATLPVPVGDGGAGSLGFANGLASGNPGGEGASTTCSPFEAWDNGILGDVPEARGSHRAVWTGSEMIVWGGSNGQVLSAGYRYDPVLEVFTPISPVGAPEPRQDHTAVWTGSELIIWGGRNGDYPEPYDHLDTGARYDPSTDTWTRMTSLNAPSPRSHHTAVWAGTGMLVWGGTDDTTSGTAFGTGGRYDPVADAWTPISPSGAPSPRYQHKALWTGSKMIVWGGNPAGANETNTGGRYDPSADTWQQTSLVGAAAPRYFHSAVWTGAEMIVWGGSAWGQGNKNSGARYDPAADSWTSMPVAPVVGSEHTAVWTGAEMIVWRGNPYDGARYNPSTNDWDLLPSEEEAARIGHTSVWTGSEMIVWGGSASNIGGRFDPALNAWSPVVEPTNPPMGRHSPSAVWTGNLMLIWGGAIGPYFLAEGARYDPLLDVWTPMSITGQPHGRAAHTAVWTGDEMIVWGGNVTSSLNTGGRDRSGRDPPERRWPLHPRP